MNDIKNHFSRMVCKKIFNIVKVKRMKAIIITKQGSAEFLKLKEIDKPSPKDNEVLIKVQSTTVTAGDVILRKAGFFMLIIMRILGFKKKKTPGTEFAGTIEKIGAKVTDWKVGDEVYGTTTGLTSGGAAEYICLPEKWKMGVFTKKPINFSFEEAAATVVGGMTAFQLLQKAAIQKGDKVLVYGASGSVGSFAVQLAKYFGATVTGICSTKNIDMVKSLGADLVLDYTKGGFKSSLDETTYDVVFDAVGKLKDGKKLLSGNGKYLSVKSMTSETTEKLLKVKEIAEEGKLKPYIDKSYSLEEIVEAHIYVESGHKRGNVVITIN